MDGARPKAMHFAGCEGIRHGGWLWRVLLSWSFVGRVAVAAPDEARAEGVDGAVAEDAFDRGVEHFEDANYAAAARAFLQADTLDPDSDSLSNALLAAQRAGDHLLVAEVARRAGGRADLDPGLASAVRDALSAAARHLAWVELSCEPAPCTISVDGAAEERADLYLGPGTHRFIAEPAGDAGLPSAAEDMTLTAGARYVVHLRLTEESALVPVRGASVLGTTGPVDGAGPVEADPTRKVPNWTDEVVLIAAGATTLGLVAATTWSGIDAENSHAALPSDADAAEIDAVRSRIVRTDVLLGTTIAAGLFTAGWALFGVDYETSPVSATASPQGFAVYLRGALR